MRKITNRVLELAEAADGFYDGSLDELPWTFWLQDLSSVPEDIERMLRIWAGDYLEVRRFGEDPNDEYRYIFRDGQGLGEMLVSENMAFQYFRWFSNVNQMRMAMPKSEPAEISRGLPTEAEIWEAEIPEDGLLELLSAARSIAMAYVGGDEYFDEVRDLVFRFQGFTQK